MENVLGWAARAEKRGFGERARLEEAPRIPRDLRDWLHTSLLRELVTNEVMRLDWRNPEVVGYLNRFPEYRPQVLLSLLVLGYAIQEFESEGISLACERHPDFQALCQRKTAPAQDLIKFRRANRPLVEVVLGRVLQKAFLCKDGLENETAHSAGAEVFHEEARRRLDIARHLDTLD